MTSSKEYLTNVEQYAEAYRGKRLRVMDDSNIPTGLVIARKSDAIQDPRIQKNVRVPAVFLVPEGVIQNSEAMNEDEREKSLETVRAVFFIGGVIS